MLAEHDRPGPALAAKTATFPLNDVDFASSTTGPPLAANLVFPDSDLGPLATVAPKGLRLVQTGGASRDRTDDLMLAKQPLSQLSYGPILVKPQAPAQASACLGFRARRRGGRSALRTGRFVRLESEQIARVPGGPGTTRTSDLTLIRGAL
jgi:hypothetical protein